MGRGIRWACAVLALVGASLGLGVAAPASACGCGAYIPDRPGPAVATERALVAWDGTREDVLVSFNVSGSSDAAAWVMPVPTAAKVTLGDPAMFDELARITAPRVEYRDDWWPSFRWLEGVRGTPDTAGAPPGGSVRVLGEQRIGPFDVTRLAADDANALAKWLADNGFPNPDRLNENLASYVERRWELVAIKLVPADGAGALTGDLQPLRLSFDSDALVYPMRLSRSARTPQTVDLYVLSDHRMDPTSVPVPGQQPTLKFADRVAPADVSPALAAELSMGTFLTRWSDVIAEPRLIDDDFVFAQASADTTFHEVVYVTRDRGAIAGVLVVVLAGVALLLGALFIRRRRRS